MAGFVAVAAGVHDADVAVAPGRDAALAGALEHEHDVVLRQVADQQPLVQAPRGTGTVTPPAVRARADDVRAVDDQRGGHLRNLEKSLGRSRFAAAVS